MKFSFFIDYVNFQMTNRKKIQTFRKLTLRNNEILWLENLYFHVSVNKLDNINLNIGIDLSKSIKHRSLKHVLDYILLNQRCNRAEEYVKFLLSVKIRNII